MYLHIHIHIIYIYMFLQIHIHTVDIVYICIYLHIHIYVHIFIYLHIHIHTIYICIHIHIHIHTVDIVYICIYLHIHIHVYMCRCVHMSVCVRVRFGACMCAFMCVCVSQAYKWICAYSVFPGETQKFLQDILCSARMRARWRALCVATRHTLATHTHTHTRTKMCHDVCIRVPWFIDVCAPIHLVCHVLWLTECVGDDVRPGLLYRHLCHRCCRQGDCPQHIDRHYHNHDQIWRRR